MIKILLLILLIDSSTGEIGGAIPAGFETRKACEEAKQKIPTAPAGFKVRAYCVDPNDTLI